MLHQERPKVRGPQGKGKGAGKGKGKAPKGKGKGKQGDRAAPKAAAAPLCQSRTAPDVFLGARNGGGRYWLGILASSVYIIRI